MDVETRRYTGGTRGRGAGVDGSMAGEFDEHDSEISIFFIVRILLATFASVSRHCSAVGVLREKERESGCTAWRTLLRSQAAWRGV